MGPIVEKSRYSSSSNTSRGNFPTKISVPFGGGGPSQSILETKVTMNST